MNASISQDSVTSNDPVDKIVQMLKDMYPGENPAYLVAKAQQLYGEYGADLELGNRFLQTIYIAPGEFNCRVYALPYMLRSGQSPSDIAPNFQSDWKEIARLGSNNQKLHYLDPLYADLEDELIGQAAGTHFSYVTTDGRHQPESTSLPRLRA